MPLARHPELIQPFPSCVYFVKDAHVDSIKIGYTTNLKVRLAWLRSEFGPDLEVLGFMEGGRDVELSLHEKFGELRRWGEWFFAEEPLTSFIATHAAAPQVVEPKTRFMDIPKEKVAIYLPPSIGEAIRMIAAKESISDSEALSLILCYELGRTPEWDAPERMLSGEAFALPA